MQTIKYIILVFLFVFSTLIGKIISNQYVYRLKELEEMKVLLNTLKTKIKFTYEPIPEIFKEISEKNKSNISNIFKIAYEEMKNYSASEAWGIALNESENNLKEEDKQVLNTLSKLLRNNRYRWAIKSNRSN